MQRSRIEALLASFPKLAASGTQHTTVEQDNVRYVYQPLDELYMVLITNRQSNILQDIDSLHLFAQVVQTICKSLDEREILKHAFELLSAFDELVTLGYRENLTLSQIKTFLDMESHEERIQEIIARVGSILAFSKYPLLTVFLTRTKNSKRVKRGSAKQNNLKCNARRPQELAVVYQTELHPIQLIHQHPKLSLFQIHMMPITPRRSRGTVVSMFDKSSNLTYQSRGIPARAKGMQLGKKSKTTNAFEQIREELGPEAELSVPVAPQTPAASTSAAPAAAQSSDREPVHIIIAETIAAKVSREGTLESFEVKGTVQLRISDAALTQLKLNLVVGDVKGASLMSHPKVDKTLFKNQRVVQTAQGFPKNQSLAVVKWTLSPRQAKDVQEAPINFNVWVNDAGGNTWNITVEYEWAGGEPLKDVMISIPYSTSEPAVSSFDAVYEVSGDSIDWTIGSVDEESPNGSFEFEAQASDESEFFPMAVHFTRSKPFIDIDVSDIEFTVIGLPLLMIFLGVIGDAAK
jgi:hypothetical protein